MSGTQYQSMVQSAVKPKFKGKHEKACKTKLRYPDSAEREYQRIARTYMRCLNRSLKEHLPEMMEIYKEDRYDAANMDGFKDIEARVKQVMNKIAADLEKALYKFGLDTKLQKIARATQSNSVEEWKRAIRQTLGIDITKDYYKGELYDQAMQRWVSENISKIKTMPGQSLQKLNDIVLEGYKQGKSITQIQKEIQDQYDMDKHKAEMLARDQVSTLNAQITKMQQQDAGVKKYRWSSSRDSRVRECHQEFDGQTFEWDDPPEAWYSTKTGIVYTGRFCNPGEDYCCRCVAIPIFDYDTIDVPMKGDED